MTRKSKLFTTASTACLLGVGALVGATGVPAQTPEAEAAPVEEVAEQVPETPTMVEITGEAAYYWPRWRGPSGQGLVSDDYDYAYQWSGEENVLWKVEVPGADSASPIVWGDKIFVVTSDTKGDDRARSIVAFSTANGELLWKTDAPVPDQQPNRRRIDRSIATPVTDGERVYAHLGAHGLIAVDFEGKQVWHRPLGTFDHATSSPLLFGDYVIVVQVLSQRRGSVVYAYSRDAGYLKWRARRDEMFASGTPIAVQVGGDTQVVVSAEQTVRAYDSKTGNEIWKVLGTEQNSLPTPVVGFGMVFVTSGPNGQTMAIHPNGEGNVTGTHIAWKVADNGPLIPSPIFYDGYLYLLNDKMGTLTCHDGATGEAVWSKQIVDTRSGGLTASPVIVAGRIYVTDVIGDTHVFATGPEFKFLGTNRLGEEVRASPALSEGVWYFRTKRHLIAIGAP